MSCVLMRLPRLRSDARGGWPGRAPGAIDRVLALAQLGRDLGHRQAVQVAEYERDPLGRRRAGQRGPDQLAIGEPVDPRRCDAGTCSARSLQPVMRAAVRS